ncbi:hypothetical protein PCASD_02833 [Puccinia coronata f. sp. avenae]|uniref:Mso1 N-terminal domain-containing protein n=1 Tax=Puccinia coronata f. sp. avenae TaxID=200324 RepID=A0A2N5VFR6_9BASI|nr:hypothetical protein PCASD_02833 [Puccinia coronata f. sp. avenae]
MSHGRPSPRPGELYNQYGPPKPPMGYAYGYARSEAGGTRPGRPPQRYPMAEPPYWGASSRPAQRPPGYAGSSYQSSGPALAPPSSSSSSSSSGRWYNREPPSGGGGYRGPAQSDYNYPSSSRPSAMTDDRNPSSGFRKPPFPSSRRLDARDRPSQQPHMGLPPRRSNQRPLTPEQYYNHPDEAQPDQPQASTEAEGSWSWNVIKKTVWGDSLTDANQSQAMPPHSEHDQAPGEQNQENQNSLWAKLANVGATIQKKLHNDEGYASDCTDYEGESHLTRIMKKYYVEKAESAYDLPKWLFTAAELQEAKSHIQESQYSHPPSQRGGRQAEPRMGGRGALDDIFAAVDESRGGGRGHARQGSDSTKHSYDSGYGSSAEPARRRRGRYEEKEVDYAPSPFRNRADPIPAPRPPPGQQRSYNQPPPRQYQDARRPPPRVAAPPTTMDYFPRSGQNERYPMPAAGPPPVSHSGRRYVR